MLLLREGGREGLGCHIAVVIKRNVSAEVGCDGASAPRREIRVDTSNKLIFDIGFNNGDDTDHYFARGVDVLAVEANPELAEAAAQVRRCDRRLRALPVERRYR